MLHALDKRYDWDERLGSLAFVVGCHDDEHVISRFALSPTGSASVRQYSGLVCATVYGKLLYTLGGLFT